MLGALVASDDSDPRNQSHSFRLRVRHPLRVTGSLTRPHLRRAITIWLAMPRREPPSLAPRNLGDVGMAWVKGRLAGSNYLPLRRALSSLSLESGRCWTWATPRSSVAERDFVSGLPPGVTQESQREAITHFVVNYLSHEGRIAIIEDHDAGPSDEWLTTNPPSSP